MRQSYFQTLHTETDSRFWINNPTAEEMRLSLGFDVFSCTTNPAYCSRLLHAEPEFITGLIDGLIPKISDYDLLAAEVYRQCAKRAMNFFMPVYQKSGGEKGFVALQDNPLYDHDAGLTLKSIEENRKLCPNYMAKVPVVESGVQVIEACVEMNIPICATEVFAVSQALHVADRYAKACERYGNAPPMYITHISGIFDDYLRILAKRGGIAVDPDVIDYAGVCVARKEFELLRERGYDVIMLGGGVRETHHFTGLIGGPHITINWNTAAEIQNSGHKVVHTIDENTPEEVVRALCESFPDFRRAYEEDRLSPGEYAGYGPVQLFRNMFLSGWYQLLAEIARRKQILAL